MNLAKHSEPLKQRVREFTVLSTDTTVETGNRLLAFMKHTGMLNYLLHTPYHQILHFRQIHAYKWGNGKSYLHHLHPLTRAVCFFFLSLLINNFLTKTDQYQNLFDPVSFSSYNVYFFIGQEVHSFSSIPWFATIPIPV